MRASHQAGSETDLWVAGVRRTSTRVRHDEQQAKAARVAVVLSLFLVLLVAALLVGGRAVLDPLLQEAADAREARRLGDIVYALPDGTFCRHQSFDNLTGELTEGTIQPCAYDPSREHRSFKNGFAWRAR